MTSSVPPNPWFSTINFNEAFFSSNTSSITIDYANATYLKRIGIATSVASNTTFSGAIQLSKPFTLNGTIDTDRLISNVYYNLIDKNSLATTTGQIYANTGVMIYDNNAVSGSHSFATSNSSGVQSMPFAFNSLGATITTNNPLSGTLSLAIYDSSTTNQLGVIPNVGGGLYNFATDAGNILLLGTSNAISTETIQLSTWSGTNNYVKIRPTSVGMGAGSATSTATTSVECNRTSVLITPSITFPNGSVQSTAYTGLELGFQEGLIIQDKNYNYDNIQSVGINSIFGGAYNGSCFAGSANNSVCGLTTANGADVWLYLPVGTTGAPQVSFTSLAFAPDVLTFSANGNYGILLGNGLGVNQSPIYLWYNNTFTITTAPLEFYVAGCLSADGKYGLVAEVSGSTKCRLSTNYGLNWLRVGATGIFFDVDMSATGKYMMSVSQFQDVYVSRDFGTTWVATGVGTRSWFRCCMSRSGQYMIALANDSGNPDRCYSSNDFGITWVTMGSDQIWDNTCMTDDGRFQIAWYNTGYYYSSNFGVSWTNATGSPTPRFSSNGKPKFSNQGKYITGNDSTNPNYVEFTELW